MSQAEAALQNSTPLSQADVEQFHRDGWVVPNFRFSKEQTDKLRYFLFKLFELNPGVSSHTNSPHVPGSGTMGVKSFHGWMEFCEHPTVLDMVEQLIGPDIILWGTSTFYKKAAKGGATPWHRDTANQMIKPLNASPLVWIAATDANIENGCMRFIPGSNQSKEVGTHEQWTVNDPVTGKESGVRVDPALVDESKAIDCELEAGQMVIFNAHTIHGSRPNQGLRDRASFTLRYLPSTSKYDHDNAPMRKSGSHGFNTRPLMLVRGVDHAGNDFRRGHPGLDPNVKIPEAATI
jgi:chlorinating enzyme